MVEAGGGAVALSAGDDVETPHNDVHCGTNAYVDQSGTAEGGAQKGATRSWLHTGVPFVPCAARTDTPCNSQVPHLRNFGKQGICCRSLLVLLSKLSAGAAGYGTQCGHLSVWHLRMPDCP